MILFLCKRFAGLIALLIVLSTLVFFFTRSLPGDVAALYVGGNAKPEQIERARIELGLDKPLYVQYQRYMVRLLHGDMGTSLRTHRPVFQDLLEKIPMSFEIVLWALLIATLGGLFFGVLAAYFEGSLIDEIIKWFTSAAVSVPIFFLALLLQLFFFNYLGWFPLQGRMDSILEFTNPIQNITGFSMIDTLISKNFPAFFNVTWHMVLPVVSLLVAPLGVIARLTRTSLLDVMEQDYILAARASGISESVLFFYYGLRNALSPVLTVIGMTVAVILMMTFYVEMIFNWPGIGYYSLAAIMNLDYTAIMGVTLMISAVYVIANTLMDILRRAVDPRIK
ncbi:ABC transporter permease [Desulfococcaceae bacterium HSG9]|nr:ABC transporter permease [Desulfococcaceae bacterium HSG9]